MLAKLLAFITSVTMLFTGAFSGGAAEAFAAVLSPVSLASGSINDSFLSDLDKESGVCEMSLDRGYYKNIICLFMQENTSLLEKFRLFRENSLWLIGWSCPADMYVVKCRDKTLNELNAFCEELMRNECVFYASPVYAKLITEEYTPNDPFEGEEELWSEEDPDDSNWWLEAINARGAWDYTDYMSTVKTGVVDSGFDTSHEDLEDKIYFPSFSEARRNRPASHGTHVAGIIAANGDNGVGISGVSPKSQLICVDWNHAAGQFWINDLHILFGLTKCVKAGAKAINFSLGSSSNVAEGRSKGSDLSMKADARLYSSAIASLLAKGYDFLVVQSAGNGNKASNPIDSYYNGTFCSINLTNARAKKGVTAKDITDRIIIVSAAKNDYNGSYSQAYFSNVGYGVDIAAPGYMVYSCDPDTDTGYGYKSGTSMSAPVVTGVASLVWSVNPELTGAEVKQILLDSCEADCIPYPFAKFKELDYPDYGLVNAKNAVEKALTAKYSMGRVAGKITSDDPEAITSVTLSSAVKQSSYQVNEKGAFNFVCETGTYNVIVNGETAGTVQVTENETVELNIDLTQQLPPEEPEIVINE